MSRGPRTRITGSRVTRRRGQQDSKQPLSDTSDYPFKAPIPSHYIGWAIIFHDLEVLPPRSSHLDHSASCCTTKPNKASMTLMLAAASICATDALERQLAPPGFECCERELLGRSKRRVSDMRKFRKKETLFEGLKHFSGLDALGRKGSNHNVTIPNHPAGRGLKCCRRALFGLKCNPNFGES